MGHCVSFFESGIISLNQEVYTHPAETIPKIEIEKIKVVDNEESLNLSLPPQSDSQSIFSWKKINK